MSSPHINSKLPLAETTIFTVMSVLAQQHNAVNLGQGFPDFSMSNELTDLVSEAMKAGRNQYVHMNGLPLLRERLSEKVKLLYNTEVDPLSDITVTPGGTYAIYSALTAILQPGDEVIIFEPAYDSYIPNILINKAIPVIIPLSFPDYRIDWGMVRQKITSKTRAIIINTPHNPTGTILDEQDIIELKATVKGTDIFIISDEVYEHLIFDKKPHLSMLRYPELFERSFVCFSFGKVFHCTGWKLGYCIAPEALSREFRKVHQFNSFTCNSPMQYALADYLQEKEHYLQLGSFVQQKRDYFQELMSATKFKALPTSGSYFQLYDYSLITDAPEKEFAVTLTEKFGVATIPVSAFYSSATNNKVLRFCFVKRNETLEAAVEKLLKL